MRMWSTVGNGAALLESYDMNGIPVMVRFLYPS